MCNVSLIAFFIYIYIYFTEDCTGQSVTYIYNNYRDKTFKTITKAVRVICAIQYITSHTVAFCKNQTFKSLFTENCSICFSFFLACS